MDINKLKIKTGVTIYATDKVILSTFANMEKSDETIIVQSYNNNELSKLCEILTSDDVDKLIWVIYPKTTSKKYESTVNRNTIFDFCEDKIFRPVAQVSLNDDLSAVRIRFRKYVK